MGRAWPGRGGCFQERLTLLQVTEDLEELLFTWPCVLLFIILEMKIEILKILFCKKNNKLTICKPKQHLLRKNNYIFQNNRSLMRLDSILHFVNPFPVWQGVLGSALHQSRVMWPPGSSGMQSGGTKREGTGHIVVSCRRFWNRGSRCWGPRPLGKLEECPAGAPAVPLIGCLFLLCHL